MSFLFLPFLFFASVLCLPSSVFSQSVGIFGSTNLGVNNTGAFGNASAVFDISSTSKGILIPRMTAAQIAAMNPLPAPAQGLLIYQTDGNQGFYYNTSSTTTLSWALVAAAGGTTGWNTTGNAGSVDGTNFIGTTDNIPFNIRVNNQKAGRISSGDNLFLGYLAGANSNVAVKDNIAIGDSALYTQSFATAFSSENVAIGNSALFSNNPTSTGNGYQNTAVGNRALRNNTTAIYNTAIGFQALYSNTSGLSNTASGKDALYSNTTGGYNTASGLYVLYSNKTGSFNTANGYYALYNNVAGSNATAIGNGAMLYANNTATAFTNYNVAVGFEALRGSTTASANTGNSNTALGYQTLLNNTTGGSNSATGYRALYANTTGTDNTATGWGALTSNTTANYSAAFGTQALYLNTIGAENTAIGYQSLSSNTTGSQNTAVGWGSLYTQSFNNAGSAWSSKNTAIGYQALYNNAPTASTNGIQNTAVGVNALLTNTTGSNNTAIGFGADVTAIGLVNATAIGYSAKADASNTMILGATGANAVNVGIGTTLPLATLDVTKDGGTVLFPRKSTTADPAGAANGMIYYNTFDNKFRAYQSGGWMDLIPGGGSPAPWSRTAPNIFLTTATDKVGIGTGSPTAKLEVADGVFFKAKLNRTDAGVSFKSEFAFAKQGSDRFSIGIDNGETGVQEFYIYDNISNITRLHINSSGNVGIGTTAASSKLNIEGAASGSELFRVSNDANATKDSVMVITSAGNVGIGTTAPGTPLHVASNVGQTGISMQVAGINAGGFFNMKSRGTILAPTAILNGDYIGGFAFNGYDGSAFGAPTAEVSARAEENFILTSKATSLRLSTTPSGSINPTERFIISPSGNITIPALAGPGNVQADALGNLSVAAVPSGANAWTRSAPNLFLTNNVDSVGIGTLTPTAKLQVVKTGGTDAAIAGINSGAGAGVYASNTETGAFVRYAVRGEISVAGGGVGQAAGVYGISNGATGGANGVYGSSAGITGTGVYGKATHTTGNNTGVWGETPSNATNSTGVFGKQTSVTGQVYGVIGETNSADTLAAGVLGRSQAGTGIAIGVYGKTSSATGFAGYFDGGKNYFQGNVGIGTTSPSYSLHILHNTNSNGLFLDRNSALIRNSEIHLAQQGISRWSIGNDFSKTNSQDFFIFDQVASATRFFINSAGNVGIGTASPTNKLEISGGNVGIVGANTLRFLASGGGDARFTESWGIRFMSTDNPTSLHHLSTNSALFVGYAPTGVTYPRGDLYVQSNVGIGTTSPSSQLHLSGGAVKIQRTSDVNANDIQFVGSAGTLDNTYWQISHRGSGGSGPLNGLAIANYPGGIFTPRLAIDINGNVGIGTTSPTTKMQIVNNAALVLNLAQYTTDAGGPGIVFQKAQGTSASPTAVLVDNTLGGVLWQGYGLTGFSSGNRIMILGKAAENWTDAAQGTYLTFSTTPVGSSIPSERVRIASNGNVGIGTTGPGAQLEVVAPTSGSVLIGGGANTLDINTGASENFRLGTGGTERLSIIATTGFVGIGCASPTQALYVTGNIYATGSVLGSQAACSDIRWKKNFIPLNNSLSKMLQLQGLYYYFKTDEFSDKNFSKERQIGMKAQEVEKLFPELIFTDNSGFKYLDYSRLTTILVEAIKEQQTMIDSLKHTVGSQQSAIGSLQTENKNLKAEVEKIKEYLELKSKK